MEENPYKLADDIWGISFKTADTIASKLGIEKNRFIRTGEPRMQNRLSAMARPMSMIRTRIMDNSRSGLMYTLNKLSENGHCFAVREQLIETAVKLLDVEAPELEVRRGRRFPREFFPAHFSA